MKEDYSRIRRIIAWTEIILPILVSMTSGLAVLYMNHSYQYLEKQYPGEALDAGATVFAPLYLIYLLADLLLWSCIPVFIAGLWLLSRPGKIPWTGQILLPFLLVIIFLIRASHFSSL